MLLLILGYKLRKQCILIGKNPNSVNTLNKQLLVSLYRSIVLLLFLFLLIFLYLFLLYPFAVIKFYILITYLLMLNFFKVSLTYFDFMISILIVICNHIHCKAFDHVNSKVFKISFICNLSVFYIY